jgi:ketosteroid isomerase-like protein
MSSSKQENDPGILRELEAGLRQAVAAREVDTALTYFSDDVTIFLPNERLEGKTALKESMSRALSNEGFTIETTVISEEKADRLGYTVVDYKVTTLGQDGDSAPAEIWSEFGKGRRRVVGRLWSKS